MATYGLSQRGNQGMSDLEIAYASSAPFSAGVETVRRFLISYVGAANLLNGATDANSYQMGNQCAHSQITDKFPSDIPTVAGICFPDVLKRIQGELDSVIGRDRMPTFDDEGSLPFLRAFIKEVTRRVLLSYLSPLPC